MRKLGRLAVIGSGPSALYFLKHLLDGCGELRESLEGVVVFEKTDFAGYGMPYHPETTDRYNRANISSEELPELPETFFEWLEGRDAGELVGWGIAKQDLSRSEVYCRLALGSYFHAQFVEVVRRLHEEGVGVGVGVRISSTVADIADGEKVGVSVEDGGGGGFDTVVIASGHAWPGSDRPEEGFYASPWPIFKLLPEEIGFLDFPIGTLGASLSAFDVISSLSHRHGEFFDKDGQLAFRAHMGAENFHVVMHSSEGWLPHLQWDQVEPFREIYRHVTRDELLSMRGENGFLRLETFFDRVCRPALVKAFTADGITGVAGMLGLEDFGFAAFVEEMSGRHEYLDSFEGMRKEMVKARDSVENHKPIHWKETLDDLMYCLNYHAELMPAEDHVALKKTVMPFLMNVIAALPLQSAEMLLALHDAGKLSLVAGKVTVEGKGELPGTTRVTVEGKGGKEETYRMFVDCSGQKAMEADDYPFRSMAEAGVIRDARAEFLHTKECKDVEEDKIISENGRKFLRTGGIDIDAAFRVIGKDGEPNPRIYDIGFPHTSGVRPYSYGLQACNATAGIVVESWLLASMAGSAVPSDVTEVSQVYDRVEP